MNEKLTFAILGTATWVFGVFFLVISAGVVGLLTAVIWGAVKRAPVKKEERWKSLRVLVVDDSFLFRQAIQNALKTRGIDDIEVASDGLGAVELAICAAQQGRPYGLIFLDWNMPKATGLDVIARLRKLQAYDRTPVFMISAQTHAADVIEALRAGVTGYVTKPLSADKLQARVLDALMLIEKGFHYKAGKPEDAHDPKRVWRSK